MGFSLIIKKWGFLRSFLFLRLSFCPASKRTYFVPSYFGPRFCSLSEGLLRRRFSPPSVGSLFFESVGRAIFGSGPQKDDSLWRHFRREQFFLLAGAFGHRSSVLSPADRLASLLLRRGLCFSCCPGTSHSGDQSTTTDPQPPPFRLLSSTKRNCLFSFLTRRSVQPVRGLDLSPIASM